MALIGSNNLVSPETLQECLDLIAHRGPDDEGYSGLSSDSPPLAWGGRATPPAAYQYEYAVPLRREPPQSRFQVGLGSRRLAITDTSVAGHQPYSSADGSLWLVFNGEIYNHLELRAELVALGHSFRSRCDTETLLAAYAAWGPSCLPKLHGQFAFVLVDCQARTYFAARDRFAIKPLYYTCWEGCLCLASEIKQFTRLPGWQAALNHQAAFEFLRWGALDRGADTMFANVHQVRGGYYLQGSWETPDAPEQTRWYTLRPAVVPDDFTQASSEFSRLLHQAVLSRADTDQPLGVSLSGGLDSSSIASILATSQTGPTWTFSAGSEDPALDERALVEGVVRHHPSLQPSFCVPSGTRLLQQLPDLVWQQDEPFNGTSLFAEWCVFELAKRRGVRVSLEGHGADECLLGYASLLGPYTQESIRGGRWRSALKNLARAVHSGFIKPRNLLGALFQQFAPSWVMEQGRALRGNPAQSFPAWLSAGSLQADPRQAAGLGRPATGLRALQESGIWSGGLAHQLHWADRNSMAHSIESRLPYLDHRVVEFCLGLPANFLFRRGRTKAILRQAMRSVTPDSVLQRVPKLGYATAETNWIRQNPEAILKLCAQAIGSSQGILNERTMTRCRRIVRGQLADAPWLWRVISFGLWLERFQVQLREPRPAERSWGPVSPVAPPKTSNT